MMKLHIRTKRFQNRVLRRGAFIQLISTQREVLKNV